MLYQRCMVVCFMYSMFKASHEKHQFQFHHPGCLQIRNPRHRGCAGRYMCLYCQVWTSWMWKYWRLSLGCDSRGMLLGVLCSLNFLPRKPFTRTQLFSTENVLWALLKLWKVVRWGITVPILQIRRMKLKEVNWGTQGHITI